MEADFVIDDDYVKKSGSACKTCGNNLEDDFDEFLRILTRIGNSAITGGKATPQR